MPLPPFSIFAFALAETTTPESDDLFRQLAIGEDLDDGKFSISHLDEAVFEERLRRNGVPCRKSLFDGAEIDDETAVRHRPIDVDAASAQFRDLFDEIAELGALLASGAGVLALGSLAAGLAALAAASDLLGLLVLVDGLVGVHLHDNFSLKFKVQNAKFEGSHG